MIYFAKDKMENDKIESSNICFFDYSFPIPIEKQPKKIFKKEALRLFNNILTYHKPIEYKPVHRLTQVIQVGHY